MSNCINYNGKVIDATKPVVAADSHGLKYGEGLFETMKLQKTNLKFAEYHFQRLFSGLQVLEFDRPHWMNEAYFTEAIANLARKNRHVDFAKARLMMYRGRSGPGDQVPEFIIETSALQPAFPETEPAALVIGIYPHARKSMDRFSSLKTNNFLPYMMAARYARQHEYDDCLLFNAHERICDSSIANLFLIRETTVITPSLEEGCIAGVMRRFLLTQLPLLGFEVLEKPVTVEEVEAADEIFLTNAVQGIRFVKQFAQRKYQHHSTKLIRNALLRELS